MAYEKTVAVCHTGLPKNLLFVYCIILISGYIVGLREDKNLLV